MINDGGPAYPNTVRKEEKFMDEQGYGRVRTVYETRGGQTLRDAFAMAAMQGMLAYPGDEASGSWHSNATVHSVADHAYRIADAMLSARDVNNG